MTAFKEVNSHLAELRTDVDILKKDVTVLKKDVAVLKEDVAQLKNDMVEQKAISKELQKHSEHSSITFDFIKDKLINHERDIYALKHHS